MKSGKIIKQNELHVRFKRSRETIKVKRKWIQKTKRKKRLTHLNYA